MIVKTGSSTEFSELDGVCLFDGRGLFHKQQYDYDRYCPLYGNKLVQKLQAFDALDLDDVFRTDAFDRGVPDRPGYGFTEHHHY